MSNVDSGHRAGGVAALDALAGQTLPAVERMHLRFALARVYRDQGDSDRAFDALLEANDLYRERLDYDVQRDVDFMR